MLQGWIKSTILFGLWITLTITFRETQAVTTKLICEIQGSGFSSQFGGNIVKTQGVVTADFDSTSKEGFYIQDENCDADSNTSDAIFVYLDVHVLLVDVGDLVEVTGTVTEYSGLTEIKANQLDVIVISSGNSLPDPVDLNPPFENTASKEYFESLEGMLVRLNDAVVVGPTSIYDETWVVRLDLGINRVYRDDSAGTGELICVDDSGHFEVSPEAKVGDQISGLYGVVGLGNYPLNEYRIQLLTAPVLLPENDSLHLRRQPYTPQITIGTLNLENLFDTVDDPLTDDPVLSNTAYQRKLNKLALAIHNDLNEPAILAVQEAENISVLNDLIARSEIVADYGILLIDGADARGIDNGILYRKDQVAVVSFTQYQGCTSLIDGLGPDGNRDVDNPQNSVTCDTGSDGVDDGNRLFSRPPLVAELTAQINGEDVSLFVIANHWKSKGQDTDTVEYTLPRRTEQAQFVANLTEKILSSVPEANLIVMGDLNDFVDSDPLDVLNDAGLINLIPMIKKTDRYTYIYQGVSQVLDHILVAPSMMKYFLQPEIIHFNADYPYAYRNRSNIQIRSSDHDPVLVQLFTNQKIYLPLIIH